MAPVTLFFLASDLGPTGATRQLSLLAPALPRDRFRVEVGVFGPGTGPVAEALTRAGIPVHPIPLRHLFDVSGIRSLRRVVAAANPAVIHAWGPAAVRLSRLVTSARPEGGTTPRLVVSGAAHAPGGFTGWLTARALRRADRIVPGTRAEGERYRRLGVRAERLTRISPGVAVPDSAPDPTALRHEFGLPPSARIVLAAGRLDPAAGLKNAVWAFDVLKYESPDLHLVVCGDGPDRDRLDTFGKALAFDDYRVRFVGSRADLPRLFPLAEAVWVTHERGGVNLALEAMAAGRPVVGWQTPELGEVVAEGETGFLVPVGDRIQLSAKTRALLEDPASAARVGAAGRARAAEKFGVSRMAEQFARLYGEI